MLSRTTRRHLAKGSMALLALFLLAGCPRRDAAVETPPTGTPPAQTAPAQALTVTPVDAAGLKKAIAERQGKVVMVNFWATWCDPCVKEFPDMVQVHERYRDQGVDLVTVTMDSPSDVESQVIPFLQKHNISTGAFISEGSADAFISGVDPEWQGDVPRTYIYGRDGKLAKVLEGEQSAAEFEAALKPLLAQG